MTTNSWHASETWSIRVGKTRSIICVQSMSKDKSQKKICFKFWNGKSDVIRDAKRVLETRLI
jgi:hypothetical protein